jgi:AhpD family alkylhydroperoxidase
MSQLTAHERALVSLGAAMGSNCISCVEHHVPASRRVGLSNAQISEAIRLADEVRQVPARKTLNTALGLLSGAHPQASPGAACDQPRAVAQAGRPCCD